MDLHGNTIHRPKDFVHPLQGSFEFVHSQIEDCQREPFCRGVDPSLQHVAPDPNHNVRRRMNLTLHDSDPNPRDCLENLFREQLRPNCSHMWRENSHQSHSHCEGPSTWSNARIIKWPHTFVFKLGGSSLTLNDLPPSVTHRDIKLKLRGAMLNGGAHFTAAIRCPRAWMVCDGLNSLDATVPRFVFHPLSHGIRTMGGRNLDMVTHEVVSRSTYQNFADMERDWSESFPANNRCMPGQMHHDSSDSDAPSEDPREIAKIMLDISQSPAKPPRPTVEDPKPKQVSRQNDIRDLFKSFDRDKSGRKKKAGDKESDKTTVKLNRPANKSSGSLKTTGRCPKGWSFRKPIDAKGKSGTCQSCNRII